MGDFTFAMDNSFISEHFQAYSQDLNAGMDGYHDTNSYYSEIFNRMAPALSYESQLTSHHMPISDMISGTSPLHMHSERNGEMTAQEMMDIKAQAASRSHSEAERRRRERINNHLTNLRTMLPSTSKTDKASLFLEVIDHVKNLKCRASLIGKTDRIPTENDEIVVDTFNEGGKKIIKVSLCCEDRLDLLPDLIKALKCMRLNIVNVKIATVDRRCKTLLYVTGEDDMSLVEEKQSVASILEALKTVVEKKTGGEHSGNVKRHKT